MMRLQIERGAAVSAIARCSQCGRRSGRVDPETAAAWAKEHECRSLTDAEALELSRLGACLAFTADRGWHLIPVAEGLAAAAAAL